MEKAKIRKLHEFYKQNLIDVMTFWSKNGPDLDYGGIFTCLDRTGEIYNTDKSVWFQGRALWVYSHLYNTFEKREEWLKTATSIYRFLIDHCSDKTGKMYFSVTRDGKPLQKRRYIFSETFAIIGLAEYSRACGDKSALDKAWALHKRVLDIYRDPLGIQPKIDPATRTGRNHSLPMILLATTQCLREIDPRPQCDALTLEFVDTVLKYFFKPDEKALFENVGPNGERMDSPQGRLINPGHAIESAWFIMHEGLVRNDRIMINTAIEILDCSLEIGWDTEYGGLLSFVDIEGKPPEQLEWDMKMWWPHTEALYATLLAHSITGSQRYEEWFDKIHDYSFNHFADSDGEWFGYLHRDGSVSNTLKGSMWKGPFHLPRALLLCTRQFGKMIL
ncbi:MAG: AGE family epimerase/isomerase [Oscillospiraceae bacterium]|nr:AGE family epimerase/isomerase [Oscillospiraceae bacterium]